MDGWVAGWLGGGWCGGEGIKENEPTTRIKMQTPSRTNSHSARGLSKVGSAFRAASPELPEGIKKRMERNPCNQVNPYREHGGRRPSTVASSTFTHTRTHGRIEPPGLSWFQSTRSCAQVSVYGLVPLLLASLSTMPSLQLRQHPPN